MSPATHEQAASADPWPASTGRRPMFALVGNPNTGKSSLFNRLTGSWQRVGNFPGLTVEKRLGQVHHQGQTIDLLDLPGLYTLDAISADEWIVHHVLHGQARHTPRPDAILCVLEAGNLKRNLFLVTEVAQTGLPLILVLNMADEALQKGMIIDHQALARRLGVPVLATAATRNQGIGELKQAMVQLLKDVPTFKPLPAGTSAEDRYRWIEQLLQDVVTHHPRRPARRESIDTLLTHRVFGLGVFVGLMYVVFTAIYTLAGPLMDGIDLLFALLGQWAGARLAAMPILQSLVSDGIISGVGGVVIFLPQILILFFFIALLEDTGYMSRAAFLMDRLFSWCGLSGKSFVPLLSSYACAIPGIMAARTIEDPKGRLTTMLIAPLMSCSARLPVYVLLIGAFIEPHHGPWMAGLCLLAMHFLGLLVAMPCAWVINRVLLRGKATPFLLELPPYRLPAMRDVLWRMYERGREFVLRAGTIIFALSIIIWAMCYFPRPAAVEEDITRQAIAHVMAERMMAEPDARQWIEEDPDAQAQLEHEVGRAYLEQSYMGTLGKAVQPVFAPAGFDWKITVSVLASFPAREVLISTMGILYDLGGEVDQDNPGLMAHMRSATHPDGRPVYTLPVVAAIMVFFALCMQCASTVAILAREAHWKWAVFAFVYMTTLAWLGAVVSYQLGSLMT